MVFFAVNYKFEILADLCRQVKIARKLKADDRFFNKQVE